MAVINIVDRGAAFVASLRTTFADTATNSYTFTVPAGAVLDSLVYLVTTVFNGTTPTVTITDGTLSYATAVATTGLGAITLTNSPPKFYASTGTITVTLAGTTVTAGAATLYARYVIPGNGIMGIQQ